VKTSTPSRDLDASAPFPVIYREYFGFVWYQLLRLGVHETVVEDALQDVFVVVHRRLAGFEARSTLRVWLHGIVRRIAYRYRRGAQRLHRRQRAWGDEIPTGTEQEVGDYRLRRILFEALGALDPCAREVIELHVFEERSGPEVAQILGINANTAYSRIKAARKSLRAQLARRGVTPGTIPALGELRRATRPPRGAHRRVAMALALRVGTRSSSLVAAMGTSLQVCVAALAVAALGALGAASSAPATLTTLEVRQTSSPASPSQIPAPVDLRSAASPEEKRIPPVRPAAIRSRPAVSPSPPPPASIDELGEEVALLTRAKAALEHGEPATSLEVLNEHARRYPHGRLTSERIGYLAIARCRLGDTHQTDAIELLRKSGAPSLVQHVLASCNDQVPLHDRTERNRRLNGT